jgi:hypothetical protein
MPDAASLFSNDYFQARDRFRQRVRAAGGNLETLALEVRGPQGEDLSIDIGVFGNPTARRVLLHSSGIHGVEGFAGSAIQLQLIDKLPSIPNDGAIIVVHTLNPYGMAWLRRVNEENVDLNRNSLLDDSFSGAPSTYVAVDPFLNPASSPSHDAFFLRVTMNVLRYGWTALKQAVAGGQYEYPRGLFFGGKRHQPGLTKYQTFLKTALRSAERVVAIDVHTGLGKFGKDILLVDTEHYETMKQAFGPRVVAIQPEGGPAYRTRGGVQFMLFHALSHARVAFIGQEFGTYNPLRVIHALREENRWHHFGRGTLDHPTKREIKEVFYPSDVSWRESVLNRGSELIAQASRLAWQ